jgi:predicted small secreted protein
MKLTRIALLVLLCCLLNSCNTLIGLGRDLRQAGRAMTYPAAE